MEPQRNEAIPKAIQDELARLFPDLSVEEALQHQESLYQSLKTSNVKQTAATSSQNMASTSSGSSNERNLSGEPSRSYNDEHDLALDEALARSLEELDMDDLTTAIYFEKFHSTPPSNSGSSGSTSRVPEITPAPAPDPAPAPVPAQVVVVEDDINPDEMTYEELQSLGESIGVESRGMPQNEISRLPTRIYRTGFFRKKIDLGECPVCFSGYKNNESFTTLPCMHQYHMKCINEWLAQNKTCPICKKEVVPS